MFHETSYQIINMYSIGGQNGMQCYCDTSYSRGGVNQMWILQNSKDLLEYIQSRPLSSCNNIKSFDFSTIYRTIPYSKLKDKLWELVQLCFIKKNGQRRYKYLALGRDRFYFVNTTLILPKSSLKLISSAYLSFWLTTYFVWWTCFSTDSAPLLAHLFLYSHEADFIQELLK